MTGRSCYAMELSPAFCDGRRAALAELHRAQGDAGGCSREPFQQVPSSNSASMSVYDLLVSRVS